MTFRFGSPDLTPGSTAPTPETKCNLTPACRAHELALTFVLLQQSRQTPNLLLQHLNLFVFEGEIFFQRSIRVGLQQLAYTPKEITAMADVLESSIKQPFKNLL